MWSTIAGIAASCSRRGSGAEGRWCISMDRDEEVVSCGDIRSESGIGDRVSILSGNHDLYLCFLRRS